MKTNRVLVDKTKPLLKDSFLEVFACILLASTLPQIALQFAPQNILLNITVICVSASWLHDFNNGMNDPNK